MWLCSVRARQEYSALARETRWHAFRSAGGMKTTKRLLIAALLPLSMFACASDPNKQADDAHAAELKSERKQQVSNADERADQRVAAAGAERSTTTTSAGGSAASQDSAGADAKLTEARAVFRAKATERLEKADARTSELKQLIDRAGAKATTASRDAMNVVGTQRTMVTQELDALPRVANDNWNGAKTSLDSQLTTLESLVKKAADEVGKFKH